MKLFRSPKYSLRTRFALGLGTMLLPLLMAAVVSKFYLLPRLVGPLEEIVYEITEEIRPVVVLEIALLKAGYAGHNYLILGNPAARAVFERSSRRVEEAFVVASPERFHAEGEREVLRAAVEAQPFDVNLGAPIRITVSIGVASFPAHADNAQALVAAADAALYAAKQSGRNRIIRYEPALGQPAAQG